MYTVSQRTVHDIIVSGSDKEERKKILQVHGSYE